MLVVEQVCWPKLNGTHACCNRAFIGKLPEMIESKVF